MKSSQLSYHFGYCSCHLLLRCCGYGTNEDESASDTALYVNMTLLGIHPEFALSAELASGISRTPDA